MSIGDKRDEVASASVDDGPMVALVQATAGPWTPYGHQMRYRLWHLYQHAHLHAAIVDEKDDAFVWVALRPDGREIARSEASSVEMACLAADAALRAFCEVNKNEAAR